MIVDDSALFRHALCSLLVAANIEIVGMAANGVQAVGQASELQPDLILMDVRMPEMSGIEAARIVKASHPNIKIVMLSGVDDGRTLSRAMSLGVDGFISNDWPIASSPVRKPTARRADVIRRGLRAGNWRL